MRSFKKKIAFSVVAISTIVSVALLYWAWHWGNRTLDDELDHRLEAAARLQLASTEPRDTPEWIAEQWHSAWHGASAPLSCTLLTASNTTLFQSPDWPEALAVGHLPFSPARPATNDAPQAALIQALGATTIRTQDAQWRVAAHSNGQLTAVVAVDRRPSAEALAELLSTIAFCLLVAAGIAAALSCWLTDRTLHPLSTLIQTLAKTNSSNLHRYTPADGIDDEFQALNDELSSLMSRLELSFHQASRFASDAAHELQTPLTILQGNVEEALRLSEDAPDELARLQVMQEQVGRLKGLTKQLLLLTKADAGTLVTRRKTLPLTERLQGHIEDLDILAPNLTVETELAADIRVSGVVELVEIVLQNLFSNAVKYNHPNGAITVCLATEEGNAVLRVGNTGATIRQEDRDLIFERLFRGERSRSGRIMGVGLGLSLAREIAVAHDGDLTLEPEQNDGWTWFRLTLPLANG